MLFEMDIDDLIHNDDDDEHLQYAVCCYIGWFTSAEYWGFFVMAEEGFARLRWLSVQGVWSPPRIIWAEQTNLNGSQGRSQIQFKQGRIDLNWDILPKVELMIEKFHLINIVGKKPLSLFNCTVGISIFPHAKAIV